VWQCNLVATCTAGSCSQGHHGNILIVLNIFCRTPNNLWWHQFPSSSNGNNWCNTSKTGRYHLNLFQYLSSCKCQTRFLLGRALFKTSSDLKATVQFQLLKGALYCNVFQVCMCLQNWWLMVSQQIAQQQTSLSSLLVQKGDGGEQMFFNPGNCFSHNPLPPRKETWERQLNSKKYFD